MQTESKQLEIFKAALGGYWPLAYGRHVVRGNLLLQYEYTDATFGAKTRLAWIGIGEGELDGIDRMWVNGKRVDPTDTTLVHFHPGIDGVLGHGLTPDSTGGDQLVDIFFSLMPANVQAITLSRLAYVVVKIPPDTGAPGPDIDVLLHIRGKKVRIFDATGAQTGYQFSTNPAWCILDFIITRFLKREALTNAALTANEKARIDFAAAVTAAADCDVVCPDGTKRFELNLAWSRQTSAQAILEQMLGLCRGYLVDASGAISLSVDKARAPSFTLTHEHIPPQSVRFTKPLRGQANRLTAVFRDLNVARMATISAIARVANVVTVTYTAAHGFRKDDYIDNVDVPDTSFDTTDNKLTSIPAPTQVRYSQTAANAASAGGYSGMSEQRFRDASWPCQHNQHALATGQRGIGLAAMPKWTDLALDFGNNVYAQVQRVLKYLKTRYLGDDSSPYKGPWSGTIRAYYGAVDATDRILAAQLPGDLLTLDRSVTEEFQNDYEIIARRVIRPAQGSTDPKLIEFDLLQYVSTSFIDNPDASPGIASPVPRAGLIISGGPANGSYRPTADPLTATDAGITATINIASVPMRFSGISPDPVYGSGAVTGLSFATQYFIYADDPDRQGGVVAYAATTTKENALSQSGWLFMGSIITPNDGAGDTVGNGDGGAGAQVGRLFSTLPGTYSITPSSGLWNNPANAVDTDTSTYADVTTAAVPATFEAYDFPALFGGFGSLLMKIKNQFVVVTAGKQGEVDYSLDGGSGWLNKRHVTVADGAPVTDQIALSVLQDPRLVHGRITVPQSNDTPSAYAGTAADSAAVGTVAWGTPANAQGAPDGTYTTATWTSADFTSHYLKTSAHGFAIPGGATIVGITVNVVRKATRFDDGVGGVDSVLDNVVKLVKATVVGGTNKADAINEWDTAGETKSYGSATDLWGAAWTPADINNAGFGVVIAADVQKNNTGVGTHNPVAKIDSIQIVVAYDAGGGASQVKVFYFRMEAQQ